MDAAGSGRVVLALAAILLLLEGGEDTEAYVLGHTKAGMYSSASLIPD